MILRNKTGLSSLFAVFIVTLPFAASAYGPEGMFGGRLNPDNTYTINMPAQTQTAPARGETVLDHARPDYDPQPISAGSFNIYPSVETGASYDSNIFASHNDTKSSTVLDERPMIVANSNWNSNALSIVTFGDFNQYLDHTTENYNDAVFQANGRIDVMNQTWIGLRGGYQHLVTPRGSADNVNGSEPTQFNVYSGGITAYRGAGLINAQLDYDIRRLDYDNTPGAFGGEIDTSNQTRDEQTLKATIGYDLTGNFKPYVAVAVNRRDYENTIGGFNLDSRGYEADAGVKGDLGGIVLFDAYAGWISQDYYNYGPDAINDGFDFGGHVTWNVTGLTTVVAEANRSVQENPFGAFNSFMATGGSLTVTHELLRNLLIEADASYTRDDFQGVNSQTQNYPSFGGGLRWLINQNFYTDLLYNYQSRTDEDSFERNIISLRINMHL